MYDILVYLFETYGDFESRPEPDALARKLAAAGFDSQDIGQAMDWLGGLSLARAACLPVGEGSYRVLAAEEARKLDPECLGFLSFLESSGVVPPPLREVILEQAMASPGDEVLLDQFKLIVLMVLWSRDEILDTLIIEELLSNAGPEAVH